MTPAQEAEVVRTHRPFVLKHARKWRRLELEDATQTAALALLVACRSWRADGGANLRTFASSGVFWRLRRADELEQRQRADASLDAELNDPDDNGAGLTLHDMLGTPPQQEEIVDASRRAEAVREAIETLPARQRDIVQRRYFNEQTLREIGVSWGLSRERIRQLEVEALRTLKKKLEGLE